MLFYAAAHAQRFQPLPGPLLVQEVQLEAANECVIYFENLSGDSLRLRWRSGEVSKPDEWNIDLCDYGQCYTGVPASGTMNPVSGPTRAYLKLIVQPGTVPGQAWLWFRVWELGEDSTYADVYFSVHTPGIVSTGMAATQELEWLLYPNPAQDVLSLQHFGHGPEAYLRIWASSGQPMWAGQLAVGCGQTLPVGHWPRGLYFVAGADGQTKRLLLR
ncbi:MAG TPA: T9SS type A sorting domain-containing protein [Saprospiraceae bacterium]|nr:T9SS type A sorting domain-containing protein [Saprospiraceae bacterium]